MSEQNNNIHNSKTESILGIVIGFLILFLIFDQRWMIFVSLIVGLAGLFSTFLAQYIDWAWMKFVRILGWINSRILLSLVFFVVLLPLALLSRLFKKDPLMLKKRTDSYFKERNHTFTPKDLEHPW
ncbi:MAG: hypothetical protein DHS20C18_18860 [Saprospiraceae bacterium]|nr:MAG: hypothetical protein DHS20C18_18860 [Saprospiraceae bacterium]